MDLDNPFLVLRLSANASAADIRAVGQRMAARARLGASERPEVARRVEAALEQLRDPVQRFLAGIVAPQVGAVAAARFQSDARFAALDEQAGTDLSPAVQELVRGESELVSQHARGCFAILQACALLHEATDPRVGVETLRARDAAKSAERVLAEGLRDFRAAIARPEFWIMQRMRAKQIDDPRLTPERVQRIQDTYPEPLLQRLCKIADTALANRSEVAALAVVRPLQAVMGREDPLVNRCLGAVYQTVGQRIEATVKNCAERAEALTGPEGEPFEKAFSDFRQQLKCDLDLMLIVGDLPGTIEERARDSAATFLRGFAVDAGNKAKACSTAIAALELAKRYAVSPQLKSNIEENLGSIKEIADSIGGRSDLGPIFRRMEDGGKREDHRAVLAAVNELIRLVGESKAGKWRELAAVVSSRVAVESFQQGIQCANLGQRDRARALLEEALGLEPVAKHRAVIQNAINQLNGSGKSGCLIPLALLLVPGFAAAISPTLWRAANAFIAVVTP